MKNKNQPENGEKNGDLHSFKAEHFRQITKINRRMEKRMEISILLETISILFDRTFPISHVYVQ